MINVIISGLTVPFGHKIYYVFTSQIVVINIIIRLIVFEFMKDKTNFLILLNAGVLDVCYYLQLLYFYVLSNLAVKHSKYTAQFSFCTAHGIYEQNMNRFFHNNIQNTFKSNLVHDVKNKIFMHKIKNVKGKVKKKTNNNDINV